jgi:16S rRNA (guanine527-N7)-methyltransferase
MTEPSLRLNKLISDGLEELAIDTPIDGFFQYLHLLYKWNHAYNLTAVRDMEDMATKHVLDSLTILPWVKGTHVIDVGSGAGLPGIPLALARPDLQIVLLDSNGKKSRFLQEVKRVLSLTNVSVIQSRAEDYRPAFAFDTIMTRAFSSLEQMINWTHHLIATDGIWLAMKGRFPTEELAALNQPYRVETYGVSGVDGDRCCVIINKE